MIRIDLKNVVFLNLMVLSFNLQAQATVNKDFLVKQCHDLSENIISLVISQAKKSCVEKLVIASSDIENAGDLIDNEDKVSAKQKLDTAIYTLQYAELNNCNRYIQISHSKFEAQRIRNYL